MKSCSKPIFGRPDSQPNNFWINACSDLRCKIELSTNHFVGNFYFRSRVLTNLTRTDARRTNWCTPYKMALSSIIWLTKEEDETQQTVILDNPFLNLEKRDKHRAKKTEKQRLRRQRERQRNLQNKWVYWFEWYLKYFLLLN